MPFSRLRRRAVTRLFALGAAAFALSACDIPVPSVGGGGTGAVQVAMLVPSGAGDPQIASLARSLTNAGRLAVQEAGSRGVTVDLRVYDTAGSAAQTAEVARLEH